MLHKKKIIVLYFKEDTIDSEKLQSAVPSLTSRDQTVQAVPLKKKKKKGKGKERKRECERGEKEKENEKKEEKGKEEKKKEEK